MAGGASQRDMALSLLAAANNHGDLSIKLSSLTQVKDILLSSAPSLAAEVFPYLADLHSSPVALVRRTLIEVMEETGVKAMEYASTLMPALLTLVKDVDPVVARQSIVSGSNFFHSVLEEMALQFNHHGAVEKWLEELWAWMHRFKDAVFVVAIEPGCLRIKLMAIKFMETCVLLFTSDSNDNLKPLSEVSTRRSRTFNISWLGDGHPILDPMTLSAEANRIFGILLNFLRPVSSLPGLLTIAVVTCLATIARKRPIYYGTVLTTLQNFDPISEMTNGAHAASIQYSIRTAFLGFLRCTQPAFLESRDKLIKALRAVNAGDAADQVVRQVDKMMKNNERALRDCRKDDQSSISLPTFNDLLRKRSLHQDYEEPANGRESKRSRYAFDSHLATSVQMDNFEPRDVSVNGAALSSPIMHSNLTPVEQMIAMICALLAEGDRGAESLDILISNIHPDLLADIVINNMKHLSKAPPPMSRLASLPVNHQIGSSHNLSPTAPTDSLTYPVPYSQVPLSSLCGVVASQIDLLTPANAPADYRRDPRRDLRRMDPRRATDPSKASPIAISEENMIKSESGMTLSSSKDSSAPEMTCTDTRTIDNTLVSRHDDIESLVATEVEQSIPEDTFNELGEMDICSQVVGTADVILPPDYELHKDPVRPLDFFLEDYDEDKPSNLDYVRYNAASSDVSTSEKEPHDIPSVPSYVDLTDVQKRGVSLLAVQRIIDLCKHSRDPGFSQTCMPLIARLVAQSDGDTDFLAMLQKHLTSDYQNKRGLDLTLNILYHLHTLMTLELDGSSSSAAVLYEKVFLAMAKSLLDGLPASDKSFSRLLGEVPVLPDSALKLLDDLCCSVVKDHSGMIARDGDRVTQGLGAVWSLILGRPPYREACLNIALKCAVHSQDDVRAKAIRLVANKLYLLDYISKKIEDFALNMLISAVGQHTADSDISSSELKSDGEIGSRDSSFNESHIPESRTSEHDAVNGAQPSASSISAKSSPGAQHFVSLFFALCTKKPSLLQFIFDTYDRSPKSVKQAVNRHISVLIRSLGSTCSELLRIISNPPQGSENLISIVLQILTEEKAPSPDLIATVKLLYETKLQDASILIPVLSSLSKAEVLPIFPQLVNLPLDKFKTALAYILQGSAHTGPALTPAEVLVAIHDILPEKDSIPLKKITDACSACFEQRIVFTQQVLAKALSQMVDQTPLPLLFMRTVIQAIDAFPNLVDCVMEILLKLVGKQIWIVSRCGECQSYGLDS
uniref:Symplekin n=1 Tax=Kalanchoe fedtschenkoi TaxID=63787 RepID=A0A7N1A2C5_KALFE